MTLLLDTTNQQSVWFALLKKGELVSENTWTTNRDLSERLIFELQSFLKSHRLKLADLRKIAVVIGPGQFSSVRTGVATANALAFGLSLKVVGVKQGEKTNFKKIERLSGEKTVQPFYDRQPNISKPKKVKLQKIKW